MEGRFRSLSRGSTRYDMSHESNTLIPGLKCELAYHMNAMNAV